MKMPHPERAEVDLEKVTEYVLSPTHPKGRHKARPFASRLGLTLDHAARLRQALLLAACRDDAAESERDSYGQRYVVDFEMSGPAGATATVRSAWIVRLGEDFPRFVTCYVTRREG